MSKRESYLMFLASLMMKSNFFIENYFRLIIFYFNFHFKECSQSGNFGIYINSIALFLLYFFINLF